MMATLGQFPAFIGANTAAMHMAWMQKVPVVFFPGPADPKTDGPLDPVPGYPLRFETRIRKGVSKRLQSEVTTAVTVEAALAALRTCLGRLSLRRDLSELSLQSKQ